MGKSRKNAQSKIEGRVKSRARREKIQDIALVSLYAVTALGTAIVAPNAVQLLKHVEKYIGPQPKLNRRLSQAITRLIEQGLVERQQTKKGPRLVLTDTGSQRANLLTVVEQTVQPRRWDRKWRIVIFDVWETRHNTRDRLRTMLRNIGFVRIQNSVWVFPYPCEELFALLRTDLKLGKGMLYIVADEIENDEEFREFF